MRTIFVIYIRIESTYKYKRKNNIAPEKASHKHRGFSGKNLLKQFFCFIFVFMIFLVW